MHFMRRINVFWSLWKVFTFDRVTGWLFEAWEKIHELKVRFEKAQRKVAEVFLEISGGQRLN